MPVILPLEARDRWLDPAADPESLSDLLRPFGDEPLGSHPVSTFVNSPRNDTPACIEPLAG
jgi:putative SOS response-associated peptidase YedK